MRSSALKRWAVVGSVVACAAGAITGCPPRLVVPPVKGPTTWSASTPESVLVTFTPLTLIATAEHENDTDPATPPAALGGPYDGGIVTSQNNRKTPELLNELTPATAESEFINDIKNLYYDMSDERSDAAVMPCVTLVGPGPATTPCLGAEEGALIYIQPEIGMLRSPHANISDKGLVVARIINYDRSGRIEAKYGFPPGAHTWWVVDKEPAGLRSRFVVRNYNGTISILRNQSWPFTRCNHRNADPTTRLSRARFWDCTNSNLDTLAMAPERPAGDLASYVRFASFHRAAPPPPRKAPFAVRADAWITCAEGCCIAGP